MKKVYQTVYTNAETGVIGNCLAACLASILELPLETFAPYQSRMKDYHLVLQKLRCLSIANEGPPPLDGKYYIASYIVAKSFSKIINNDTIYHSVVWKDGRIVHDPRRERVRLYRINHHYKISVLAKCNESA